GRLPQTLALVMAADRPRFEGMVYVQVPVHDVNEMHHQIGQDAPAEVPEPAPVPIAKFVERLVRSIAEERLPVKRLRVDCRPAAPETVNPGVAVPGEVNFVDRSQPAGS